MQIGCINVIYLCQRIEIFNNNDMKKAQVEYNSKGKNASWDANRLVREYIGIAWMTNDTIPFQKPSLEQPGKDS